MRKKLTWRPHRFIPDISHFRRLEADELTIPGDAENIGSGGMSVFLALRALGRL